MSLSEGNAKTRLEQIPVTDSPRPMGLIRAHSPRSVNPFNPFNPSYPCLKEKSTIRVPFFSFTASLEILLFYHVLDGSYGHGIRLIVSQ